MKTIFKLFGWKFGIEKEDIPLSERIIEYPFAFINLPSGHLKILDIGSSESSFGQALAALGYDVVGLDIRKLVFKYPNYKFVKADAMKLPFKDNSFDVVTAISTIEHVGLGSYGDPIKKNGDLIAIKEIQRVLKNKGILILTTVYGKPFKNKTKFRTYNKKTFTKLMKGFRIIKNKYYKRDTNGNWVMSSEKETAKVSNYRYCCGIVLCVAEKK